MSTFITLGYSELKSLFLNRYVKTKLILGSSYSKSNMQLKTSLPIRENISDQSEVLLFLSYIDKVYVDTKDQKTFFIKMFGTPPGFIVHRNRKAAEDDFFDQNEPEVDTKNKIFKGIRLAHIFSFETLRNDDKNLLNEWFDYLRTTDNFSSLKLKLVESCVTEGSFPKASITQTTALFGQHKLQYVFLAEVLKSIFFEDSLSKSEKDNFIEHRDWLRQFDPDNYSFEALRVPDKYHNNINTILGYLLALELSRVNNSTHLSFGFIFREIEKKFISNYLNKDSESGVKINILLFETFFFIGLFQDEYNSKWHTKISQPIMGFIDEKSYKLTHSQKILSLFCDMNITELQKSLNQENRITFEAYSEVVSEESTVTKKNTDADRVKSMYRNKSLFLRDAIFFVNHDSYLQKIEWLLKNNQTIKNLLIIIYYSEDSRDKKFSKIELDTKKASITKHFDRFNVNCRVILKNRFNTSNKDTIVNIKGFCKEYLINNESQLRFDSDSIEKHIKENELLCIVNSFHKLPLYDENEDYFFV